MTQEWNVPPTNVMMVLREYPQGLTIRQRESYLEAYPKPDTMFRFSDALDKSVNTCISVGYIGTTHHGQRLNLTLKGIRRLEEIETNKPGK